MLREAVGSSNDRPQSITDQLIQGASGDDAPFSDGSGNYFSTPLRRGCDRTFVES